MCGCMYICIHIYVYNTHLSLLRPGEKYEQAIECAKTFLLFHPDDEVMNQNLAYYSVVLGEDKAKSIAAREVQSRSPSKVRRFSVGQVVLDLGTFGAGLVSTRCFASHPKGFFASWEGPKFWTTWWRLAVGLQAAASSLWRRCFNGENRMFVCGGYSRSAFPNWWFRGPKTGT